MLNRRMLPCITMLLALLALPAGARAQDGDVPRELALALLDHRGVSVQLLEGRAPDGFPAAALPPGARILGAVVYGRESRVVAVVPAEPAAALAAMAERMHAAGWRSAPDRSQGYGVFVQSGAADPNTFCGEGDVYISAVAGARREGGSQLHLFSAADTRYSPCRAPEEPRVVSSPEHPRPKLVLPPGARYREAGSSGGDAYRDHHALIETAMGPAELVAHFAAQLREQGWTLRQPPAASEEFAVQAAALRDAEGRTWIGVLTATPGREAGEMEVSFRSAGRREEL